MARGIAGYGIACWRDCRSWVVGIAHTWDCVAGGIAGRGIASHGIAGWACTGGGVVADCVWRIVCVSSVVKKMNSESGLLGIANRQGLWAEK